MDFGRRHCVGGHCADDRVQADCRAHGLSNGPSAHGEVRQTGRRIAKAIARTRKHGCPATPVDPVFTRDILPIFQKSCLDCHGGEKPKGGLSVETVVALLKGGQSGEPAIVPGRPDASPLLRFVQDQVEDLEMPPLARRAKYPR